MRILSLLVIVLLSACASSTPLRVLEINSLDSEAKNTGGFMGMEFLANPKIDELKTRINVVYLHGIGWTEDPETDQLASDFLEGVARAYGLEVSDTIINSGCGKAQIPMAQSDHIFISQDFTRRYETALPGSYLEMDNLSCMDKHVLEVDPALEFVVYRIFWDEIFWNSLQFSHVGQDDARGASQDIANLRRKYNRNLKDELVNYGFSDAVMYLGPAGEDIRNGVRGALCAAAQDAAGISLESQGATVSYSQACNTRVEAKDFNQFAFVSESLGSKIMFDVLSEGLHDGVDNLIDDMADGSEIYMLANQIALLSLTNLTPAKKKTRFPRPDSLTRPKIIAMSELNDFLTYELVPFYEQLWLYSKTGEQTPPRTREQLNAPGMREKLIEQIGFDIVDMRLEFADPILPMIKSLVDPMQAHKGHSGQPPLMLFMLCGAVEGRISTVGCLAQPEK